MSRRLCLLALLAAVAALLPAGAAFAHRSSAPEVVASGLDNPRGLAVDHRGTVYVAEAGRGGPGPCVPGPEGGEVCVGTSGAITKAWHGGQKRIVEGLASNAAPDGTGAIGPSDITLTGWGSALFTVGLGADPAERAPGSGFAQLYKLGRHGVRSIADIGTYEATVNPDGGLPDTNPQSVTTRRGKAYVTDAGGNALLRVGWGAKISTVAVFPDRLVGPAPGVSVQAVPTGVVVGPDGALYVTQLTGFPFVPGAANVYRVKPGAEPEVYASGFTNAIDLAFDPPRQPVRPRDLGQRPDLGRPRWCCRSRCGATAPREASPARG